MSMQNLSDPLFKLTVAEFREHFRDEITSTIESFLEIKKSESRDFQQNHSTLDIVEAAQLLKVSKQTIYQNIKSIPHRKIFGRLVFLRDELLQFIDQNGNTDVRNKGDPNIGVAKTNS